MTREPASTWSASEFPLLAADLGNSALKVGLFSDRGQAPAVVAQFPLGAIEELLAFLASLPRPAAVLLSSVRPGRTRLAAELLARETGTPARVVSHADLSDWQLHYDPPTSLGLDRLLACEGALDFAEPPFAVFSFGTMLAVTVVPKEYTVAGGWILPGWQTLLRSFRRAELLRSVEPSEGNRFPPNSTASGMFAGAQLMLRSTVQQLSETLQQRYPGIRLLGTGSDVPDFVRALMPMPTPHLVLFGLRRLYERRAS